MVWYIVLFVIIMIIMMMLLKVGLGHMAEMLMILLFDIDHNIIHFTAQRKSLMQQINLSSILYFQF